MPDLSLTAANLLANVGNLALILGALLVLIGTWLTIWAGGTKERFADERISGNERLTETAKADAAKAVEETEKVRETNLRLSIQLESEKSARLKIEQGLASRSVSRDKRPLLVDAIKKIQPPLSVQVERLVGDTEARRFGDQLIECLKQAGVQLSDSTIGIAPGFPDGLTIIGPEPLDENKLALALEPVRRKLESDESVVIQWRRPDSYGSLRCGRRKTAPVTTAACCGIPAT